MSEQPIEPDDVENDDEMPEPDAEVVDVEDVEFVEEVDSDVEPEDEEEQG